MSVYPAGKTVRVLVVVVAVIVGTTGSAGRVRAQRDLPPNRGGQTYSLGMPPVYKGRAGVEAQDYRPQATGELASYFNLGLATLRLEGYAGVRERTFDGGGRALYEIPSFYI